MNRYTKWNGNWTVTGDGPAPKVGTALSVQTRRGAVKQETVAAILVNGVDAEGNSLWVAALAPRAPAARPWRNYDEVGMHGANA